MTEPRFRPERFVLSTAYAEELEKECREVKTVEVSADGTATLVTAPLAPVCAHCGQPATCFGLYEDPEGEPGYACSECCGHGNEDGWCKPLQSGDEREVKTGHAGQ